METRLSDAAIALGHPSLGTAPDDPRGAKAPTLCGPAVPLAPLPGRARMDAPAVV